MPLVLRTVSSILIKYYTDVRRKRKLNEMSWDSPVSVKTVSEYGEEEEKQPANNEKEEKLLNDYSTYLLGQLKTIPSEENAFTIIKKCMHDYKKHGTNLNSSMDWEGSNNSHEGRDNNPDTSSNKTKVSEKHRILITDAIKKLSSDNVLLKSAVRKLVEKEDKNSHKIHQFDELAQDYIKLKDENDKLKTAVDVLRYAARNICSDKTFEYQGFNNGPHGGSGIY